MEKSQKTVAQIYGYIVCLVAVITFLIAFTNLVNAVIDLGDPLHAGSSRMYPGSPGSPSLASFENYKMDMLKSSQKGNGSAKSSYAPDDQTLRAMYDSTKSDKIQSAKHEANRSIIINGLLIIICIALFVTHWRWIRKNSKSVAI